MRVFIILVILLGFVGFFMYDYNRPKITYCQNGIDYPIHHNETLIFNTSFQYSDDEIANAIYIAEGGSHTVHPYGILKHYNHTTPRQACINTINSARKRFNKQNKEKDFIHFLSLTYCPINCGNDPQGLNVNWYSNVIYYLKKGV